jgi:cellulose synthase/poly-beta-1,6-N-acetylglucosamine synthase-like glycosyltransferase
LNHEVIVLANGGEFPARQPSDDRFHFLRSRVNAGFGGGSNWAARHARGQYLVFLNDDTSVGEGWLQALVSSAEAEPTAAAVGSVAVDPSGRIQEAGRVMWRDGASHGIARGVPIDAAALRGAREVDYCSACALLVRRSAWDAVGGFDERYFPAYYEDADLSLEFHRRGWPVLCASDSRVQHHTSSSSSLLWRRFLGLRNHGLFVAKWTNVLREFPERPRDEPSREEVERAALGAATRRVTIHARFPALTPPHAQPSAAAGDVPAGPPFREAGIGDREQMARLEYEVAHLEASLRLKQEYIAHIGAESPQMVARLERRLRWERRRTRWREAVRAVPLVGSVAARFGRGLRTWSRT